ncbi:MAG TPA: hypothetical protein VNF75_00405 [Candidatus Dormibacteraeota bacterium]|nr:hypothetical protein [Candidatus Dormibacteraeota bacterium]
MGSNTVHLLVATFEPRGLAERLHAVEMVNLGHEVTTRGKLGDEVIARTADTLAQMIELARSESVEAMGLVATEAIRNAPDSPQLIEAVRKLTGETISVLTGEAEARLSYLGATAFKVPAGQPATVADVGGGSTEVVQGKGTRPRNGTSLKLGSDQLLGLVGAADPLSGQQRVHAAARVSMILEAVPREEEPGLLMATGGTASNVPVMLGMRAPAESSAVISLHPEVGDPWTLVPRGEVERALELAMSMSSAALAGTTGLSLKRARLMAGGLVILWGLLDRYQAAELTVTERGLRDGVLLALAAARDRRPASSG